jgi:hypothetical protein
MASAPPEVEARWHSWAEKTLGGTSAQIEAATQAAIGAMARGASQADVLEIAKSAWASGKIPAATPQPASPSPPPQRVAQPVAAAPAAGIGDASRGSVRGRVAGFQPRNEMWGRRYLTVWDFHIETDAGAVSVEMRGFSFEGSIANGDVVEIRGNARGNKILHVRRLENLTSNSTVRVKKGPHKSTRVLGSLVKTIFFLIWLGIALGIVYFAFHHFGKI